MIKKDEIVMVIWEETNEAIYIGPLGEVPQWLMAGFELINIGYDFGNGVKLLKVERRKMKNEKEN